jgi:hypothetical protein
MKTDKTFELDHLFICCEADAPEAEYLRDIGLTEGPANVHPGQGTANRRFFFHNAMLELLWVDAPVAAQNTRTRPTHLWERWQGRRGAASPFGICLRPQDAETATLPFPACIYEPVYLPAPRVIHMGANSADIAEPLLFYLAFGQRPDTGGACYPMTHALELQEITALRLQGPQQAPMSPALQATVQSGVMTWSAGLPHHLEIGFDGEMRGKVIDLRPALPLSLCW